MKCVEIKLTFDLNMESVTVADSGHESHVKENTVFWDCSTSEADKVKCSEKDLQHRCQTQAPRAECGPPRHYMWPLTAWKTHMRIS